MYYVFERARKICKDIAAVKNDVLAFCAANNLVLVDDTHVSWNARPVRANGHRPCACIILVYSLVYSTVQWIVAHMKV